MENEIWEDIDNYVGFYQVSNLGRVRSIDRIVKHWRGGKLIKKGKILKQKPNKYGYKCLRLIKNGKYKDVTVHRLVAIAFIPNPNNLPFVNHKDENPSNNNVNNLEWCTQEYNVNYGTANKRRSEAKSKPVLQFTKSGDFVNEYPSATEAQKHTGIIHQSISSCCRHKLKSSGGFVWKFKN